MSVRGWYVILSVFIQEPPPAEQFSMEDPYAAVSQMDVTESEPECIK